VARQKSGEGDMRGQWWGQKEERENECIRRDGTQMKGGTILRFWVVILRRDWLVIILVFVVFTCFVVILYL